MNAIKEHHPGSAFPNEVASHLQGVMETKGTQDNQRVKANTATGQKVQVHRMVHIHINNLLAHVLGLTQYLGRQGDLSRCAGSDQFRDSPLWETIDAQGTVHIPKAGRQGGRTDGHIGFRYLTDGTRTPTLLNKGDGAFQLLHSFPPPLAMRLAIPLYRTNVLKSRGMGVLSQEIPAERLRSSERSFLGGVVTRPCSPQQPRV